MKWPADKVERRPIAQLVPAARNARTHSDEQVAQIAASIREWGWTTPVLCDAVDGTIIAGHGRVLAAKQLGLEEVPVMWATGWSKAKKRAYMLADNKLPLNADWDLEVLKIELGELKDSDFDRLIGFSDAELSALLAESVGLTDPDEAPEPPGEPVSKAGDVWILGSHRLTCGDCTDALVVEKALNGVKPHLMVTDPPYGVEYDPTWRGVAKRYSNGKRLSVGVHAKGQVLHDDRSDWREAWALFPGDVAYCWHGGGHASSSQSALESCGFEIRSQIIWRKNNIVINRGHYHVQHEPCW